MPFEKGHKHAAKGRIFEHEIRKAIAQSNMDRLRKIAEKVLDMAESGDMAAIREVADRLDGKSVQTVNATVEHTVDVGNSVSFADKIERALEARAPVTVQ